MKHALIISDGKPGHVNQSIAYCKHIGLSHETLQVAYKSRISKSMSYLLDRLHIYTDRLFSEPLASPRTQIDVIVSTGSTTYYANKLLAQKLGCPNIAILNPNGYRLDFSHIFCPAYDHPPKRNNITEIPLNLCVADEAFFIEQTAEFKTRHKPFKPAIGIIIGGPNAVSDLVPDQVGAKLEQVFALTAGMERWITTSRRTPHEIEEVLENFRFDYKLINSQEPYNPIPAFIQLCERIFLTSDSASMISECASFGSAKIEVLMNRQLKSPNKFEELIQSLQHLGAIHLFDGTLGDSAVKVDLSTLLNSSWQGE